MKLINFRPHILALSRQVLLATQRMWAKVQKQKSMEGQILKIIPIFSKFVHFDTHILTFLKNPRKALQAIKIF